MQPDTQLYVSVLYPSSVEALQTGLGLKALFQGLGLLSGWADSGFVIKTIRDSANTAVTRIRLLLVTPAVFFLFRCFFSLVYKVLVSMLCSLDKVLVSAGAVSTTTTPSPSPCCHPAL